MIAAASSWRGHVHGSAACARTAVPMLLSASSDADDQTAVPSLRDLVGFTVPLLGIGLASPVLGLIDSAVVGRFAGALQLAALTPAVALTDIVAYLFRGLASATTYFVASALADGDGERERRAVRNAVTFAAACGVVAGALQYFGCVPLLQLLSGGAHHTYPLGDAAAYARVRAVGLPAALILMVMQAAFLGRREWRAPTLAVAVACVLNLLADLLLVACLHLGVLGAAVATVLAQAGAAATLLVRRARLSAHEAGGGGPGGEGGGGGPGGEAGGGGPGGKGGEAARRQLPSHPTASERKQWA